jgi:hypothetical protein
MEPEAIYSGDGRELSIGVTLVTQIAFALASAPMKPIASRLAKQSNEHYGIQPKIKR